jgi:integrase
MVLQMARPWKHPDSGIYYVRQRIPTNVQAIARSRQISLPKEAGGGNIRVGSTGHHVKTSLRTRDPREAKQRNASALAHLETVWRGLLDGPQQLTHRQLTAYAGEVYRRAKARWEEEPGSAKMWQHILALADKWDEAAILRETRPFVEEIIARHALHLDDATMVALAHALHKAGMDAARLMQRRAEGDYGADAVAGRFPSIHVQAAPAAPPAGQLSITELFGRWKREAAARNLAEKTFSEYEAVMKRLIAFLGFDNASRVTPADVVAYKDMRLGSLNKRTKQPISLKTVKDVDLSAIKSVFGWGAGNQYLTSNAAEKVMLKRGKTIKERSKGYDELEAVTILRAALAYSRTGRELAKTAAAKRWAPWICAFTGARISEALQLRREDVRKDSGHWIITLTPEAGEIKDKERRDVPVHPQLVELGFPAFVEASGGGYLFLNAKSKAAAAGPLNGVTNRVSEFVRLHVSDTRIRPNHAWRHRLITLSRRHGIDQELRRMITGHAGEGVDEQDYGDPEGLYREICKLPAYVLTSIDQQ